MLRKNCILLMVLAWSWSVYASSTRSISADQIVSADASKTYTLPAQSGTSALMVSAGLVQEIPSGSVNSSNTAFTLANTPAAASSISCTLDGLILTQGSGKDYTVSSATLTMGTAPSTGQTIWCTYSKF